MTVAEMRRWTNSAGETWECDAYDHGPFCRLCRLVKEADSGMTHFVGDDCEPPHTLWPESSR